MTTDLYQGMSDFYDTFVRLNRNYREVAIKLIQLFGDSTNILDVGIGTGLLVEQIIQLRPDLNVVGIDTSMSLLSQAEKSLGTKVALYCQDVSNLDIDTVFDLAYSRGGAWAFVKDNDKVLLASHILERDTIQRSFERIALHLRFGGQLILTLSHSNNSKREDINTEVYFERVVTKEQTGLENYLILDYKHHQGGNLVGHQRVKMLLLDLDFVEDMLRSVGLILVSEQSDEYRIYQKMEA